MVNAHLPHGGVVYWDAGDTSNYDRINKSASASEYSGQWNHWAFTKDSDTGDMKVFRNGSLWHSGGGRTRAFGGNISKFFIGADLNKGNNYKGKLDEFRIWNVARTAEQIQADMYKHLSGNISGLIACYSFNDAIDDTTSNDSSANANNATVSGAAALAASTDALTVKVATGVTSTAFTANWEAVTGAEKYFLDISTNSNFTSFIDGYEGLDIGNVASYTVNHMGSFPETVYYRMRVFSSANGLSGNSSTITVSTPLPSKEYVKSTLSATSVQAGEAITFTITAKQASSENTLTTFTGTHNVKVSGVAGTAANGTYGSFNGQSLNADAAGAGQVFSLNFTNGVATADLILNGPGSHTVQLEVEDVDSAGVYEVSFGITPLSVTHAAINQLVFQTDLNTSGNINGGAFVPQPVLQLLDQFENVCTTDSSTQVTASKFNGADPDLTGTATVTAVNGVVTFTDLGNLNHTDNDVNDLKVTFTEGTSAKSVTSTGIVVKGNESGAGNCLQLAGSAYADLGDRAELSGSSLGSVTVEAWVKLSEMPASRFSVIGSNGNTTWAGVNFGVDSTGALYFRAKFFGSDQHVNATGTAGVITANKWHHIACVYDQGATDKKVLLYADGAAAGEIDLTDTATTIWNKRIKYIGSNALGIPNFKGQIDEVRIWKMARTQTAIEQEKSIKNLIDEMIVAQYHFDTYKGEYMLDYSGNNFTATIGNYTDDTVWQPSTIVLSPVLGMEVTHQNGLLSWSVENESGVSSYMVQIKENGVWKELTTINAGLMEYSLEVGEGQFRIVAIDDSGFSQTFAVDSDTTVYLDIKAGWNLLSTPFEMGEDSLNLVKDSAVGPLWGWDGTSYTEMTAPLAQQGFWIFAPETTEIAVSGAPVDGSVELSAGWNLTGPAANCNAPAGFTIYSWADAYQQVLEDSNTLITGQGYWIYTSEDANVNLK